MIISKTPVRISFFGGGTDYPDHYRQYGGAVLSTTIDKYIFVTVKSLQGLLEYKYRVAYSKLEMCNDVEEIQHPVVKACIKFLKIEEGLEVNIITDLPARTGTGSSSAFTVGLLNALYAMKGKMASKEQLAAEAVYIEQVMLNERVGAQDQYAAAYGGFNKIEFGTNGNIVVNPVTISQERKQQLQSKLIMYYTGVARYAHQVLEEQIQKTKENKIAPDLNRIKQMVDEGLGIVCGNGNLNQFGELLHEGWTTKKKLSSAISNNFLDDIYDKAMGAGALGGKLLGAGGGGFFVFYVEDENKRTNVRNALSNFAEIPINFENDGARVIFVS